MDRRSFLRAAAAAGVAGLAGCFGGGSGDGDGSSPTTVDGSDGTTTTPPTTTTTPAVTTPPEPEKPTPLTRDGAVSFVEATERKRTFEQLNFEGADEVSVSCNALYHRGAGAGHVVLAACGGSARGDGTVVDEGSEPIAVYYVDADSTVRVGEVSRVERAPSDAYAAADSGENLDTGAGIRLYDFRSSPRTFSVRVVHLGSGETAYEADHEVGAESGVLVENVARRRGSYSVAVEAGDASGEGGWTVTGDTVGETVLTATLTPGPSLGVKPARFGEVGGLGPV